MGRDESRDTLLEGLIPTVEAEYVLEHELYLAPEDPCKEVLLRTVVVMYQRTIASRTLGDLGGRRLGESLLEEELLGS